MAKKRKRLTPEEVERLRPPGVTERWERVKALLEDRLEYHRRRKLEEERAAAGES